MADVTRKVASVVERVRWFGGAWVVGWVVGVRGSVMVKALLLSKIREDPLPRRAKPKRESREPHVKCIFSFQS